MGIVSDTVMAQLATVSPAIYMRTLPAALSCRLLKPPCLPKLDKAWTTIVPPQP